MDQYFFIPHQTGELSVFEIGLEECAPGHSFSTAFTDRFLIHYVLSGRGIFRTGGREYDVLAGNAFLIGSRYGYYEADMHDPWTYAWVNISGDAAIAFLKLTGLSAEAPIYRTADKDKVDRHIYSMLDAASLGGLSLYGGVFSLLGTMAETNAEKPDCGAGNESSASRYVELCREYIHTNYYRNISVSDVCAAAGLEYSYLFRLFKSMTGTSPGRYLTDYRLSRAAFLLRETSMSVGEISDAVGYEDRTAFSKAFAKSRGMSPKYYRASQKKLNNDIKI